MVFSARWGGAEFEVTRHWLARVAFNRAHTSVKADDTAKLLPTNKRPVRHIEKYDSAPT